MRLKQQLTIMSGGLAVVGGLFFIYALVARSWGLPIPIRWMILAASVALVIAFVLAGASWIITGFERPAMDDTLVNVPNVPSPSPNLKRLSQLANSLLEPELYMQIVERLPDALVVINASTAVIVFNEQATFLFGYHPSEVIGKRLSMLIPEDRRTIHDQHIARWFSELRARPMGIGLRLEGQDKHNRIFPVEINLSPLVAPSGIYGMAVIRRPVVLPEEVGTDARRT